MTDSRLVPVSGKQMVRVFRKIGYTVVRQKGSHIIMEKGEDLLVIPNHDQVAKGTERDLIDQGCRLGRPRI